MSWWNGVYEIIKESDLIYTPGSGLSGGNKKRPFWIHKKDPSKITIKSGKSEVPLVKECFDTVEDAFKNKKIQWLRVASSHSNVPFDESADQLIRESTQSKLARGNYVCAILEYCGLVKYSMLGNKKVIKLS
ncbi:MAG TPA: hypothetical protein PKW17_11665 [Smithellaceae bacterium]|nr:hypothetical protein [Smithellaceae bacterium]